MNGGPIFIEEKNLWPIKDAASLPSVIPMITLYIGRWRMGFLGEAHPRYAEALALGICRLDIRRSLAAPE